MRAPGPRATTRPDARRTPYPPGRHRRMSRPPRCPARFPPNRAPRRHPLRVAWPSTSDPGPADLADQEHPGTTRPEPGIGAAPAVRPRQRTDRRGRAKQRPRRSAPEMATRSERRGRAKERPRRSAPEMATRSERRRRRPLRVSRSAGAAKPRPRRSVPDSHRYSGPGESLNHPPGRRPVQEPADPPRQSREGGSRSRTRASGLSIRTRIGEPDPPMTMPQPRAGPRAVRPPPWPSGPALHRTEPTDLDRRTSPSPSAHSAPRAKHRQESGSQQRRRAARAHCSPQLPPAVPPTGHRRNEQLLRARPGGVA